MADRAQLLAQALMRPVAGMDAQAAADMYQGAGPAPVQVAAAAPQSPNQVFSRAAPTAAQNAALTPAQRYQMGIGPRP